MPERPNVVLLLTDQQHPQAMGAMDDSYETPNLDRLADDGTLFTGCHSTCPQCSPSRSSIVTGQYPHQTGMYTLSGWGPGPLDTDLPSVARSFREAGYDTVWGGGRWDLGTENITDFGWLYTRNVDVTGTPGTAGAKRDEITAEESVDYVRHHGTEGPFFLTASFNLPHPGFFEDEAHAYRYEPEAVPIPKSFADDLSDKPAFHRERAAEMDLTEGEVREIGYRYRTMVSRVDEYVGDILEELRAQGIRDDTVVLFASDHGEMLGAHRLSKKGVVAYDEILRVPLVVDVPGHHGPRDWIPDLVSNAAIPGTLLDAAGLPSEEFDGGSLLPAMNRSAPPEDDRVFFEHKYAYWGEHPYRGVRTRDWKYVEYLTDDADELYHVADDPHEMHNLAERNEYSDEVSRHRGMVSEWWEGTDGDEAAWVRPVDGAS